MARPLIGITGPSSFSSDMMKMAEKMLGANFVLLYHDATENLNDWIERIQGIIFSGGVDIHPAIYNTSVTTCNNLSKFDYMRDLREVRLLNCAMDRKIPIFGVCRGHQLIGIYNGMKLIQDISASNIAHAPNKAGITIGKEEPTHLLKLLKAEEYHTEYKPAENFDKEVLNMIQTRKKKDAEDRIFVNSFHHQGILYQEKIDKAGIRIMGTSYLGLKTHDKENWESLVEFMDDGPDGHMISVQWHPEYDWEVNSHSFAIIDRFKRMINARVK